jgi:HEXXH motif-containing protein
MHGAGQRSTDPESIFSEPLDVDARSQLAERIASSRAAILWNALRSPHDDLPPARKAAVDMYFVALRALLIGAPDRGLAHVTHWAPSFYVLYLLSTNQPDEGAAQAASNLFAMLLVERTGDGASPLAGLRIRIRCNAAGELHVFSRDVAIRIAGLAHPYAELEWECGAHAARVHEVNGVTAAVEVPLPLAEDGAATLAWRPFDRAPGFDVPILDDAWVALMRSGSVPYHSSRSREDDGGDSSRLPLRTSLGAAHTTLGDLLPEVLPWLALFVPAIVEVPAPDAPGARSSGSRLPGTPIHLSRVHDAFGHAEDLVHELQHARYQFLSPLERYFAAFRGHRRETFVSPYRTDPRPLAGIHLGLHAFVAVTRLRLRACAAGHRDPAFLRDLLRVHRMNVFSYRTIAAHERFSPEADCLFRRIGDALWEQHEAIEALVAPELVTEVEAELAAHRARVLERGGPFDNAGTDFSPMALAECRAHTMAPEVRV